VTKLDIEVLSVLVQKKQLCEEQEEVLLELEGALHTLNRDGVSLPDLTEHVCTVLKARPADPDTDSTGGGAGVGDTAASVATATASEDQPDVATAMAPPPPPPPTCAASRLARRQERIEQNLREQAAESETQRKLGELLLGSVEGDVEQRVSAQQLDRAFVDYTHLLGADPSALQRDWKTGQTVLQALNGLHGEDETKVYSGIQTRKGYALYLQIVRDLSKGNKNKVSAKSSAVEWNVRVERMMANATGAVAKKHIQQEFGFIGTKDAQTHADRLTLRVEQTQHAASVVDGLIELCSSIRELSVSVEEVERLTRLQLPSSMQHGVGGPAATVMTMSAVQVNKRPATAPADDGITLEQAKNNCYLCSENGREAAECCVKLVREALLAHLSI
jgi:hypothetical protein